MFKSMGDGLIRVSHFLVFPKYSQFVNHSMIVRN
jgi:hypothetical protein